jgi:3-oxoadipate enol-lactonase
MPVCGNANRLNNGRDMTATASSFKTRDGFNIAYELHGSPASQKRVLMIHSLAMDAAYWRPVGERLAKQGVCAVAVSCRGHGASDKPAGPYTLELFSGDMNDLLDHLKWDKAVVAGSSMGGSVSINFALNYPKRVAGLALIDTTSCYGDDAPKAWAERANAALAKGLSSLIDFQLTRWFGDEFRANNPAVAQACVDTFLKNDLNAYAATCNMLGNFDMRTRLGEIKVPTRVFVGEEDYATPPAMAEVMHKGIAGSTLRKMPKARHLTPLEMPDEVVEEIMAVLKAV